MKKYHHLFFDLDHTLWDFEANSRLTLNQIFNEFELANYGEAKVNDFIDTYERVNYKMWGDYRMGKVSKETLRTERFRQSIWSLGIKDKTLAHNIADYYVAHSPKQSILFPHVIETLTALKEQYAMSIITNGFEEVQDVKMKSSGLAPFFDHVITSEQAGVTTPHANIFHKALTTAAVPLEKTIMIGDNQEADIMGAQKVGMDQILFNPKGEEVTVNATHHIQEIKQLLDIL
jgi:putative hydrolase of the HAD superfamily